MKCYVCGLKKRETEAVAICGYCHVALCHEHLVQEAEAASTTPKYSCSHPRPDRANLQVVSSQQ